MQFEYNHLVNDLKFKVINGHDSVFEKQHGMPYKIIELQGNSYVLDFDQVSREVSLYINDDFIRKVSSLNELHDLVNIIKFNPAKAKKAILKNLLDMVELASSGLSVEGLMEMEKATKKLSEQLATVKTSER